MPCGPVRRRLPPAPQAHILGAVGSLGSVPVTWYRWTVGMGGAERRGPHPERPFTSCGAPVASIHGGGERSHVQGTHVAKPFGLTALAFCFLLGQDTLKPQLIVFVFWSVKGWSLCPGWTLSVYNHKNQITTLALSEPRTVSVPLWRTVVSAAGLVVTSGAKGWT